MAPQEVKTSSGELHPRLNGKKILFIDHYSVTSNSSWKKRCYQEGMTVEDMENLPSGEFGSNITLADYISQQSFDALIIRPVMNENWLRELYDVLKSDKPVLIIDENYRTNGFAQSAAKVLGGFLGLDTHRVDDLCVDFYPRLMNTLDQAFAAKKQ